MSAASLAFVIPSFNEGPRLAESLTKLIVEFAAAHSGRVDLVVVDDGSSDPVFAALSDGLTLPTNVHLWVLRHQVNLGQGAALQTAIAFARKRLDPDVYVSIDADGQHDPQFVAKLIAPVIDGRTDIVFGTRFSSESAVAMPSSRRWILRAATVFERFVTGLALTDAHNGLRAFNRTCARLVDLKQNRMAHATEFKQIVAKGKLRYCEVPVRVHYTEDSLQKGQRSSGSLVILKDLLKAYLFHG